MKPLISSPARFLSASFSFSAASCIIKQDQISGWTPQRVQWGTASYHIGVGSRWSGLLHTWSNACSCVFRSLSDVGASTSVLLVSTQVPRGPNSARHRDTRTLLVGLALGLPPTPTQPPPP
jgi:hypothetical protein